MPKHNESVEAQFGPRAKAYVDSQVHAQGADLDALAAILAEHRPSHALDLGAGGGHVSYVMAQHAARVTAVDLSREMLAAVSATARDKGLSNITTCEAPVEHLTFPDGTFDLVASRFSAHHWHDFIGGLRQARRVAKPGARAIFMDACSPGPALLDTHLQALEVLRDTSHVRDYSLAEWSAALTRCGFALQAVRTWRLRMDFPVWIARMRTPPDLVAAIRALQQAAPAETRRHFAIESDGSFLLDTMMIEAVAE